MLLQHWLSHIELDRFSVVDRFVNMVRLHPFREMLYRVAAILFVVVNLVDLLLLCSVLTMVPI